MTDSVQAASSSLTAQKRWFGLAVYTVFAVMLSACGGDSDGGSSSGMAEPNAPGTSPVLEGTVVETGVTCAMREGAVDERCIQLQVICEDLGPHLVNVVVTEPNADVAERGTIVFSSGGGGTSFYSPSEPLFTELTRLGYRVVSRAWVGRNWYTREGGLRKASCRYANLLTWIHDNLYDKGIFAASGNSGGSAEIAYALTTWGRGKILDLVVPTSGPAVARLDYACGYPTPEAWLNQCPEAIVPEGAMVCVPSCTLSPTRSVCIDVSDSPTLDELYQDSPMHPDAVVNYPNTYAHFIYGESDCGPSVPIGLNWSTLVTSEKTIEFAENTAHELATTPEGRAAIVSAIEAGARWFEGLPP